MKNRQDMTGIDMNRIPYRFVRDERLMKADLFNILELQSKRDEYATKLNKHPEIKDIEKNTDVRLNRRKKTNIRKEYVRNNLIYFLIFGAFLAAGISVCNYFKNEQITESKADWKVRCSTIIAIFAVIGALVGTVMSNRPGKDWKTDNAEEFYKRLMVRYFDKIHAENPDITEEAINTFNPDLSRTVYAVLTSNLSKRDIAKLDDIALTIASALNYSDFPNNLFDVDAKMEEATKIVSKAVAKNPSLQKLVNDAYMGKIPTTFFLHNANMRSKIR